MGRGDGGEGIGMGPSQAKNGDLRLKWKARRFSILWGWPVLSDWELEARACPSATHDDVIAARIGAALKDAIFEIACLGAAVKG